MVSGYRLIAVENKKVIAASMWGKVKTTIQFITLLYLFVGIQYSPDASGYWVYAIIAEILVYATLVSTVFSGIGAIEHALERMEIPYKIVFACDNGDVDILSKKMQENIFYMKQVKG